MIAAPVAKAPVIMVATGRPVEVTFKTRNTKGSLMTVGRISRKMEAKSSCYRWVRFMFLKAASGTGITKAIVIVVGRVVM